MISNKKSYQANQIHLIENVFNLVPKKEKWIWFVAKNIFWKGINYFKILVLTKKNDYQWMGGEA